MRVPKSNATTEVPVDPSMAPMSVTSTPVAAPAPTHGPGALTVLTDNLMSAVIPESTSTLFPQLKMVFAIEMQSNPAVYKPEHIGKIGLFDGTKFEPLTESYTLATIASRNSARKLIIDPTDKSKSYDRAYGTLAGVPGKSHEKYVQMCKEGADQGASFIVAIIKGEDVCIAEFPAYKTMSGYLGRPLATTSVKNKVAMKIDLADHNANFTISKTSGYGYPDSKKFRQWTQVNLTDEQCSKIGDVLRDGTNTVRFATWLEA